MFLLSSSRSKSSKVIYEAIIVIFSVNLPVVLVLSSVENLIRPKGEPWEHHLGAEVRPNKFELHKISYKT